MLGSIVKFGLEQTEVVARQVTRIGFAVARTVVGAVVGTVTGGSPQASTEPVPPPPPSPGPRPESPPPSPGPEPEQPSPEPESAAARARATPPEPEQPSPEPESTQPEPEPPPAPEPAEDPERERRMALRDLPARAEERSPHHELSNPVTDDPDPTEWPDPYDQREDPRDPGADGPVLPGEAPHPPTGSQSTSEPHPSQDPEAERWNGPKRQTQPNERS